MSQTPQERSAVARAEGALDTMGQRLDRFAMGMREHLRQTIDQLSHPDGSVHEGARTEGNDLPLAKEQIVMERAEALADRLVHRLERAMSLTGFQFQRGVARIREEGEDMLAEAKYLARKR